MKKGGYNMIYIRTIDIFDIEDERKNEYSLNHCIKWAKKLNIFDKIEYLENNFSKLYIKGSKTKITLYYLLTISTSIKKIKHIKRIIDIIKTK